MDTNNSVSNNSNTTVEFSWFHDIKEIKPGNSAILNENYVAFYTIHYTAVLLIATSLISCPIVIISILIRATKEKLDFSDRFPLYLAISDFFWGLSHLTDHLVLITQKTYPNATPATLLSINLWFFLGYETFSQKYHIFRPVAIIFLFQGTRS